MTRKAAAGKPRGSDGRVGRRVLLVEAVDARQEFHGGDQRGCEGDGAQWISLRPACGGAEPLIAVIGQWDGAGDDNGAAAAEVPVRRCR